MQDRPSLLFVDEDESWLTFCRQTCQQRGLEVETVINLNNAIERLTLEPDIPRIMFVDYFGLQELQDPKLHLPKRAESTHIFPVVLFSVEMTTQEVSDVFDLGFVRCIPKFFGPKALEATVEQMMAEYRVSQHSELPRLMRSARVLVVDDNPRWLEMMQRTLDRVKIPEAFEFVKVKNFVDARRAIQEEKQFFDLAIIDINLSTSRTDDESGLYLINMIRAKDEREKWHTRIVVISENAYPNNIAKAYLQHAYYFMDKGRFSPIVFKKVISQALSASAVT